jgi:hypothetical protein
MCELHTARSDEGPTDDIHILVIFINLLITIKLYRLIIRIAILAHSLVGVMAQ